MVFFRRIIMFRAISSKFTNFIINYTHFSFLQFNLAISFISLNSLRIQLFQKILLQLLLSVINRIMGLILYSSPLKLLIFTIRFISFSILSRNLLRILYRLRKHFLQPIFIHSLLLLLLFNNLINSLIPGHISRILNPFHRILLHKLVIRRTTSLLFQQFIRSLQGYNRFIQQKFSLHQRRSQTIQNLRRRNSLRKSPRQYP